MLDDVYIVYTDGGYDEYYEKTDLKEATGFSCKFFSNYENAEKYRDLCNLMESGINYDEDGYKIATLKCCDNVSYDELLIAEEERLNAERQEHETRMYAFNRNRHLEKYAELIAEFEGGDKWEILFKLKEKHGNI